MPDTYTEFAESRRAAFPHMQDSRDKAPCDAYLFTKNF